MPTSGAFNAYVSRGINPRAGAGASWLALLAYSAIQSAMYAMLGVSTAGLIAAVIPVQVPWWGVTLVAMALVLLLGTRSVEAGVRFVNMLVIAEFALIFAFVSAVLRHGGGPEGIDLSASFSPNVFLQGAPGIDVMFDVASMFGFEQTAIYSSEAKDPARTVARDLAVGHDRFHTFAFVTWVLVSYYGYANVVDAALELLASVDPTQILMAPITHLLGP